MSLFGAKKSVSSLKGSLKRAKENLEKRMAEESVSGASATSSSHIGEVLDRHLDLICGPDVEPAGSVMPSESNPEEREFFGTAEYERLRAEEEKDEFEYRLHKARIKDDLRRRENSQATSRVETGQLPSDLYDVRAYSDLTGKTGVTGITRYGSDDSSELSPPPTTNYGGSDISFPSQTPEERVLPILPSTNYLRALSPRILFRLPGRVLELLRAGIFSQRKMPVKTLKKKGEWKRPGKSTHPFRENLRLAIAVTTRMMR